MVNVRTREQKQIKRSQEVSEFVRDFSKLQQTEYDLDKINFDQFSTVENLIHREQDAKTRRGIEDLATVDDLLGIALYERDTGNKLLAYTKYSTTQSQLIEIDRTSGAETARVNSIAGRGAISYANLRGWFYLANGGGDIVVYESSGPTATTVALTSGNARLVASDGTCIWGVSDDSPQQVLYCSQIQVDNVTSFVATGTAINRGIIANSNITKFTALLGVGKFIVAFGESTIEIHARPDFGASGATTFPQDISTLLTTIRNNGVQGQHAVKAVGEDVYFKPQDGVLYRIQVPVIISQEFAKAIPYRGNFNEMDSLTWSSGALGYDIKKNLLYIAGQEESTNDNIISFNVQEQNFSKFPLLFADQFVEDEDGVYYMTKADNLIVEAFDDDNYTDNGNTIPCKIRTAATYSGSFDMWKRAREAYIQLQSYQDIDINYKFISNRGVNGVVSPDFTTTFSVSGITVNQGRVLAGFGTSPFGMAGFVVGQEENIEYQNNDTEINVDYVRAEIQIDWNSSERQSLRGIGFYYSPTARKNFQLTYS